MGHFGFSYVGLICLLMLSIPNAMWAKKQPEGYDPSGEKNPIDGGARRAGAGHLLRAGIP